MSRDGARLAISRGAQVVLTSFEGAELATIPMRSERATFLPDGSVLVFQVDPLTLTLSSGKLALYDEAGKELRVLAKDMEADWNKIKKGQVYKNSVYDFAVSADGTSYLLFDYTELRGPAGGSSRARLLTLDGRVLASFEPGSLTRSAHASLNSKTERNLAFAPDGKTIVYTDDAQTVVATAEGKLLRRLGGYSPGITVVAGAPRGDFFATGHADGTVRVWSTQGKLISILDGRVGNVVSVRFSADGEHLLFAGFDGSATWNVWRSDGKLLHKRRVKEAEAAFARDGRTLVLNTKSSEPAGKEGKQSFLCSGESFTRVADAEPAPEAIGVNGMTLAEATVRKELQDLRDSQYTRMAFSSDGHLAMIARYDGVVAELRNVKTGERVSLLSFAGEWAAFAEDGYYDSSRDGGRYLGMASGMTAYAVDQFAVRNNRPDLLLSRLGSASAEEIEHFHNLYLRRLRKAGFTEEQLSGELHVPTARIAAQKKSGHELALTVALADDRFALKRYNVYVNDVPLFGAWGKPVSGQAVSIDEKIVLTTGLNKVEVSCVNARATSTSSPSGSRNIGTPR